jgi:quercetin dioxygenase-like cupin family protein
MMNRTTGILGFGLAIAIAVAAIGGQSLHAQEKKKEVYVPTAQIKTVLEKQLPTVDGKQITIFHALLPPNFVGGKHYHSGPVYVYVLEGSFTIDEPGKARRTFKAGELYEEPIGTPMQAFNMNTSEPAKILVIQVTNAGEPLMYKAD